MAQPLINIGAAINDGTGELGPRAWLQKVNRLPNPDNTVNPLSGDYSGTYEQKITAAIADGMATGKKYCWITQLYNPSLVTFNNAIRMFGEGMNPEVYNARAYGAAWDGVTDDTVANQAVATAAGANGGVVQWGYGISIVTTLWLPAGVIYQGYGVGSSILRRKANSVTPLGTGFGTGDNVLNAGPLINIPYSVGTPGLNMTLRDFEVDGNGANQSAWASGSPSTSGNTIGGAGIQFTYVNQVSMSEVRVHDTITAGFRMRMCPSTTFVTCRADHCATTAVFSLLGNGFNIEGDTDDQTNPTFRQFTGMYGCEADFNADNGITLFRYDDVVIDGCLLHDNGNSAASPDSCGGIELTSGFTDTSAHPSRVLINGCAMKNNVRTGQTNNFGIRCSATAPLRSLLIQGCKIYGQTGNGIDLALAGTGQIVEHLIITGVTIDNWGANNTGFHACRIQTGGTALIESLLLSQIAINGVATLGSESGIAIIANAGTSITGCHISNVCVKAHTAGGIVLVGNVAKFSVRGCHVANGVLSGSGGIHINSNASGLTIADGVIDCCDVLNNNGDGIRVATVTGGSTLRVIVSNCSAIGNTRGIVLDGTAGTIQGINVHDNVSVSNGGGNNFVTLGTVTGVYRRGNRLSSTSSPLQGQAVLVAGTVTVSANEVLAADSIQLTRVVAGGTLGHLSVGTIVAGTSFVINASGGADTSTIFWEITH